jgi:V/A-type H+-transporting ATPase subunit C
MSERRESRKPGSDPRYTYAIGRIKALEARLISLIEMGRLLEEETQADALRALGEFPDYADILAVGVQDPEEILDEQLRQAYELISKLSLGSKVIKALRLKYDFHNLKVLLKSKLLGVQPEGFSGIGFLSEDQLGALIKERSLGGDVDRFAGETLLAAVRGLPEDATPKTVEILLDRLYYKVFLRELSDNPFLGEYARTTIDFLNLRAFWRVQLMEWTEEMLAESLLPGGAVETSFFLTNFGTPVVDLPPKIQNDPCRSILHQALAAYQSSNDLSALDKLTDSSLIEFLRKGKHFCFGLEPLVGYLAAKENETMQLRIILGGKDRLLPKDSLQELLRSSYA